MRKLIDQKVQISIDASYQYVFNYAADLKNDVFWRKEVNWVQLEEDFEIGAVAVECSFLSNLVPEYIQKLQCVKRIADTEIAYQTLKDNSHFLAANRCVSAVHTDRTVFTYRLTFNPSIVKHGLGFKLPNFIISFVTRITMKKYVKVLKNRIEAEPAHDGLI